MKVYHKRIIEYLILALSWLFISGFLAVVTTPFIKSVLGLSSSDSVTNIFVVIFSILFGFVSLIISLIIHFDAKESEDIKDFALLEPETIHNVILDKHTQEVCDADVGKEFLLGKNGRRFKFIVIEYFTSYLRFVYDALYKKDSVRKSIFAVVNKGNTHALGKKIYILYKKIKIDNGDFYSPKNFCIEEDMSDYSYIFPEKDGGDILWVCGDDRYKEFYNLFNDTTVEKKEFLVVIEYDSITTKKHILQAYRSDISKKSILGKEMFFLVDFTKLTPTMVKQNIEPDFAKKILNESVF